MIASKNTFSTSGGDLQLIYNDESKIPHLCKEKAGDL